MTGAGAMSAPYRGRAGNAALWFGVFGAPAAWSLHTLVDYPLVTYGCFPRNVLLQHPAFGGLLPLALIISGVLILAGLAAWWTAWVCWRRTDGDFADAEGAREAIQGRVRFMAYAGLLLSAVFTLGMLFTTLGLILVPPC